MPYLANVRQVIEGYAAQLPTVGLDKTACLSYQIAGVTTARQLLTGNLVPGAIVDSTASRADGTLSAQLVAAFGPGFGFPWKTSPTDGGYVPDPLDNNYGWLAGDDGLVLPNAATLSAWNLPPGYQLTADDILVLSACANFTELVTFAMNAGLPAGTAHAVTVAHILATTQKVAPIAVATLPTSGVLPGQPYQLPDGSVWDYTGAAWNPLAPPSVALVAASATQAAPSATQAAPAPAQPVATPTLAQAAQIVLDEANRQWGTDKHPSGPAGKLRGDIIPWLEDLVEAG